MSGILLPPLTSHVLRRVTEAPSLQLLPFHTEGISAHPGIILIRINGKSFAQSILQNPWSHSEHIYFICRLLSYSITGPNNPKLEIRKLSINNRLCTDIFVHLYVNTIRHQLINSTVLYTNMDESYI